MAINFVGDENYFSSFSREDEYSRSMRTVLSAAPLIGRQDFLNRQTTQILQEPSAHESVSRLFRPLSEKAQGWWPPQNCRLFLCVVIQVAVFIENPLLVFFFSRRQAQVCIDAREITSSSRETSPRTFVYRTVSPGLPTERPGKAFLLLWASGLLEGLKLCKVDIRSAICPMPLVHIRCR